MSTRYFFNELETQQKLVSGLYSAYENFKKVPDDWVVIVTDVENSTKLAEEHYRLVNTVAALSLTIGLRSALEEMIDIPYVYGGDGATLVAPHSLSKVILKHLHALRKRVNSTYEMNLRVGSMSVDEIYEAGYNLNVAKVATEYNYNQALFLDSGLLFAETMIKDDISYQVLGGNPEDEIIDITGYEPKWIKLYEPTEEESIVCIIVGARDIDKHRETYKEVLDDIDEVYSNFYGRHPALYNTEFHRPGVSFSSDALKMDGMLKTILVGTHDEEERLIARLKEREEKGEIIFGNISTQSALLTSIIEERPGFKIGLLDAENGGYTQATTEYKNKKKQIKA